MEIRGRLISENLLTEEEREQVGIEFFPSMEVRSTFVKCNRCHTILKKEEVYLPIGTYYCPECIQLGRVESRFRLCTKEVPELSEIPNSCTWSGSLSSGQEKVAQELVASVVENQSRLVHAVTGAGKTEMMFPAIEQALATRKRVGLATPRVDVVNELAPRIKESFEGVDICVLFGGSEERFRLTPITILTTHQLLRFKDYFDVLIIDEVDAFPFVNSKMLHFAVETARKKEGIEIYLTATPTKELLARVKNNEISVSTLPARFHRHKLVIPQCIWDGKAQKYHARNKFTRIEKRWIQKLLDENNPLLIFCPTIAEVKFMHGLFQKNFKEVSAKCVSSKSNDRKEIVGEFRNGKFQVLFTSTILERGVTFSGVNVIVFHTNHQVYQTSALVQISGRAGRKLERPTGTVLFFHDGKTRAMVSAIRQMKEMNSLAVKENLIDEE
jgi:competence protein ComFA